MKPIIPIAPVVPILPVMPPRINVENITLSVLLTVLSAILFIGTALLVGWLLTLVLKKQNFKTNLAVNLILSGLAALALFLRFGMSVTILQGLFLFFILLFASWSDLTDHEVTDWVWISLIPVALMSIPTVGLASMIAGAFVVFVPQIVPLRDASNVAYASRDELVEAIKAKYSPEIPKDEDNTIPDGSFCVQEEMAMQNQPEEKSFKLNTKPHKPEVVR